ncbi:endonuclease/exonuclease/phosphatase family protein [Devosia sp. CAU 1758]
MWRAIRIETRGALFFVGLLLASLIALGHLDWHDPIIMILNNLRVHLSALLVLVALLLMAGRAGMRGTVLLGCAVFALALVYRDIAPSSRAMAAAEPQLKVIAFNMLGTNVENGPAIAAFLEQSDADLVLLNESGPIIPFLEELKSRFPFQLGCGDPGANSGSCGDVLLLSRLALEEPSIKRLTGASGHQTITARIEIDGKSLNVVATHFLRPYFGEHQTSEFVALRRLVDELSGPTLVAGDFNATAWFGPFTELLRTTGLTRAVIEPGTWPAELGDFGAPIDHILVSGDVALSSLTALPDHFGSNHRGLAAGIALTPAGQ